ncbi:MAG: hypothetical protein ABI451_03900, partial [Dokdonella sp.]
AASGSCTLTYTFNPTSTGVQSQPFTVTSNGPGSGGMFTLTGEGISDRIFRDGFDGSDTPAVCSAQQIMDPGFETSDPSTAANAFWNSTSTQGGTAICDSGCGGSLQRSGDWWLWLGGYTDTETATGSQSVTIQPGFDRTLHFWMLRQRGTDTTAQMTVTIDGNVLATYPRPAATETVYTQYTLPLASSYSDGNPHVISFNFSATSTTGLTNGSFMVDDVTLDCSSGGLIAPTVAKSFGSNPVNANTATTLTITLGNGNVSVATLSASLGDVFPTGLVVSPTPNASTTCPSGMVTAAAGSGSVSLNAGAQIPTGGTCTVIVDVQSAIEATYVNRINVGALQTNFGSNDSPGRASVLVGSPIFTSGALHHLMPNDPDGLEIDFQTNTITDGYTGGLGDLNPYNVGSGLGYFWEFTGNGGVATSTANSGKYIVLQSGGMIGPTSIFSTRSGGCTGANGNNSNFCAGVNGYLGFRFVGCTTAPGGICYGYLHMTTTAGTGYPAYIEDYAFDKLGGTITIP